MDATRTYESPGHPESVLTSYGSVGATGNGTGTRNEVACGVLPRQSINGSDAGERKDRTVDEKTRQEIVKQFAARESEESTRIQEAYLSVFGTEQEEVERVHAEINRENGYIRPDRNRTIASVAWTEKCDAITQRGDECWTRGGAKVTVVRIDGKEILRLCRKHAYAFLFSGTHWRNITPLERDLAGLVSSASAALRLATEEADGGLNLNVASQIRSAWCELATTISSDVRHEGQTKTYIEQANELLRLES